MRARLIFAMTLTFSASLAAACGTPPGDTTNSTMSGSSGTAGASGEGGAAGTMTTTTTTVPLKCTPSETTDPIAGSCGVFVSPSGDDASGDGSPEKPFATITKALSEGGAIYACSDAAKPFTEAVNIDKKGIYLFGGLDCSSWAYDASKKTPLTAESGAVPLTVSGSGTLHLEDFTITAKDAPSLQPDAFGPGNSSIAIIADSGTTLELTRCDAAAGKGADGTAGDLAMGTGTVGPDGESGGDGCDNAQGEFGGKAGQNSCEGMEIGGGPGGNGLTGSNGADGSDGKPLGPTGKGGVGLSAGITCDNGGAGGNGKFGTDGLAGAGALDANGALSMSGYTGASGSDGTAGTPGQGGGGGGGARKCANNNAGPGGGGGGAAGCGGAGGKGGYGGGASITLVTLGASLKFSEVTFKAGDGANGGSGSPGQDGGPGGIGGAAGMGDATAKACPGGAGGTGGKGGQGGGGRGGHSIGIAYAGDTAPDMTGATITIGAAGKGGAGDGVDPASNGADGIAKDVQGI